MSWDWYNIEQDSALEWDISNHVYLASELII